MKTLTTRTCHQAIQAMADKIQLHRDELSALDTILGDGDHGVNLDNAMQSASKSLIMTEDTTPGDLFVQMGSALTNEMGGASGAIFGSFFSGGGRAVRSNPQLALPDVTLFFEAGVEKVMRRGKAKVGDKTMLDALVPALEALHIASDIAATADFTMIEAMHAAAISAERGAEGTKDLIAQHGRARFLGERSKGHADPGATSIALMLAAWAEAVRDAWRG